VNDFETAWRELAAGETRAWWAGPARAGLAALSGIYGGIVCGYRAGFDLGLLRQTGLPCKVVSVGNITVGGTGKTTTVRWLVRRLVEWGLRPAVLSYGYRSEKRGSGVEIVSGPEGIRLMVEASGDEPQLLARSLPGVPVLIGKKRIASGRVACKELGANVCVLDDAFQYWRLKKDLEIVLVSAANPFGYGRLLPRGMLREPLRGLRRADAVIVTHADYLEPAKRAELSREIAAWNPRALTAEAAHCASRLRDHATGDTVPLEVLREGRWLAVSSLGQPESFERTLKELGAHVAAAARFPDHHPYSEADLRAVSQRVDREGLAGVVTTEKDAVKIPAPWLAGVRCCVLEVDLRFLSGQDGLESLIRSRLSAN